MDNKILVGSVMVTAVAIMTACTGRGTGNTSDTDSTVIEPEIPIEQLFLPDTAYASVEVVKFVVEDEDSVAAPLKDLDNLEGKFTWNEGDEIAIHFKGGNTRLLLSRRTPTR